MMAFQVRVGLTDILDTVNENVTNGHELFTGNQLCGEKHEDDNQVPADSVYFRCSPNAIKGRFVTVQKTSGIFLQVEEVDLVLLRDMAPGMSTSLLGRLI